MRRFSSITFASVLVVPVLVLAQDAIELREEFAVGSSTTTKLHLVLRGDVRIGDSDEKVAGQALLIYPEKVLEVGEDGLPTLMARFYDDARAKFVFGKSEDPRQLRSDVRLTLAKATDAGLEIWSPSGPLTSDEIELIQDTIDTTQLAGLLPKKPVKVGDSWDPEQSVQRRLCDLEQFITSTISCKLESADDAKATIQVAGKIHGLAFGSEVKSNIEATVTFDRKQNLITQVAWKQIDSRAPSPVSPAGAYEATMQIDRSRATSPALSDAAIAAIDRNPPETAKSLLFEDPKHRYRFYYDRNWHVTLLEPDKAVLRRLVGNEMVAQLDVTIIGDNPNIAALTAEKLQQLMLQGGEIKIEEIVRSESIPAGGDYDLRLVNAVGKKGELDLIQRHYLARDAAGRQILLSFLVEPANEEKLADADMVLVQSIEFGNRTAGKTPANRK